jgi:hypothetical protein
MRGWRARAFLKGALGGYIAWACFMLGHECWEIHRAPIHYGLWKREIPCRSAERRGYRWYECELPDGTIGRVER